MIDKINFVYACPIPSNKTQRCCDISFKENLRAFLVSKLGKNIEHRLLVFIECKQADIFMPHFPSKFNDFSSMIRMKWIIVFFVAFCVTFDMNLFSGHVK